MRAAQLTEDKKPNSNVAATAAYGVVAKRAVDLYRKIYSESPCWAVAAPGRVNLIGEHTDYNDGFVLPLALQQRTVLVAGDGDDHEVRLHSITTGETATISLRGKIQRGEPAWANYVRGVIAGFQERKIQVSGFNAVIESEVPLGGGLSSSAALEVAAATLIEVISGRKLDPVEKALLCQKAEHDFAGVPCGIMDPFVSIFGREGNLLLLDCRSRATEFVPLSNKDLALLIINTNVRHKHADGEYASRREQCRKAVRALGVTSLRDMTVTKLREAQPGLEPLLYRRVRHVVAENNRVLEAVRALREGDWERVGRLMYASHKSLKADYEVSCRELDVVVNAAEHLGVKNGVFGCRMTGGGFGGCAIALIKADVMLAVAKRITEAYERQTGHVPFIFPSQPGSGAQVLSCPQKDF